MQLRPVYRRLRHQVSAAVQPVRALELATRRATGRAVRTPRAAGPPRSSLRILAHVPAFPPVALGGAAVSLAIELGLLAGRGHEVRVLVDKRGTTGEVSGLAVVVDPPRRQVIAHYRWCDVVVTQLESRNRAIRLAAFRGLPVVQFVRVIGPDPRRTLGVPELLVFPSETLRAQTSWPGETTVFHSPVSPQQFQTTPGTAVTLVNLTELKGSFVFFELARHRPDLPFLGVRGTWGSQIIPDPVPPNVTILDSTEDVRRIYARTRVLLMPSRYEAYPRVGLEAACSGIPAIATPLPTICEGLGDAALYADRHDIDAWAAHLRQLDAPGYYQQRSAAAVERAHQVAGLIGPELDELERRLVAIVASGVAHPSPG